MFSCEYCEIFKNSFFNRTPLVAASVCGVFAFKLFKLIWISLQTVFFTQTSKQLSLRNAFCGCFLLLVQLRTIFRLFYSSFCFSELLISELFDLKFYVYSSFRVDLAGSERLKKTHTHGERLQETQNINSSLLELG